MKCIVSKWVEKEGNQLTADNLIRINPKKPRYGSLKLISEVFVLTDGFLNRKNRIGFIVGEVSILKTLIERFNLKEGTDYSEAVTPHRIVVIEKLKSDTPENKGFREKINPSTNELLFKNGEQIMWKTEVVLEDDKRKDISIKHDRTVPVPVGNGKPILADDDLLHFVGEVEVDVSITRKRTE